MNFYNVVLLPPKELSEKLTAFAQDNFSDIAEGYCLSDTVFPHITLCQFKADDVLDIEIDNVKKAPELVSFNMRQGYGKHEGYIWCEIVVNNQDWLQYLHGYVRNKLISKELDISTHDYYPHLTFCRIREEDRNKMKLENIPEEFSGVHEGWTIQLGKSDKNGQYLGCVR